MGRSLTPRGADDALPIETVLPDLLAALREALDGDLDRVVRIVKLGGFVQAGPDFEAIPGVINGCSDLMVQVFGDAGKHSRSAVGVYKLPLGFAVEVDAIIEVK